MQRCERVYVPQSVWDAIKDDYVAEVNKITVGDVSAISPTSSVP